MYLSGFASRFRRTNRLVLSLSPALCVRDWQTERGNKPQLKIKRMHKAKLLRTQRDIVLNSVLFEAECISVSSGKRMWGKEKVC